jgi:DNA-directed RNA polymerase subunit RPC12/RpoP
MFGLGGLEFFVLFFMYIVPAILNVNLAKRRGHSVAIIVILTLVFSWLITLLLVFMPGQQNDFDNVDEIPKKYPSSRKKETEEIPRDSYVCDDCGFIVAKDKAEQSDLFCPECRSLLKEYKLTA